MKKTFILSLFGASALMISSVSANTTWAVATGANTTNIATWTVLTWTVVTTWSTVTTWVTLTSTWTTVATWTDTNTGTDLSSEDLIMNLVSSASTWDTTTSDTVTMETSTATKPADVDQETWDAGNKMYSEKVTKLAPEKTNFYNWLKRWEAALLLKRFWVEKLAIESKKSATECAFIDVANIDAEAKAEIQESCTYGLFKGNGKSFMPDGTFTRGQAIMVIARMLNGDPTMELDDSYDYLLNNKIIKVDDRKDSERQVTRSELYIMISRILEQKEAGTLPTIWAWEAQQLIDAMNELIENEPVETTDSTASSLTWINFGS